MRLKSGNIIYLLLVLVFTINYCIQPISSEPTVSSEIDWILSLQRPNGSFPMNFRGDWIAPYQVNIALTNVLRLNTSEPVRKAVKNWMMWYISRLNTKESDKYGVQGTVYDWKIDPNTDVEYTLREYDSTDSYAGTFLTLAHSYHKASADRQFIKANLLSLKIVAEAALATFNPSWNLTSALPKPHKPEAYYLMDNLEVWRGFLDFSELLGDFMDADGRAHWFAKSQLIYDGIERYLYEPSRNYYRSEANIPADYTSYQNGLSAIYTLVYKFPPALQRERREKIYGIFKRYGHADFWADVPRRERESNYDFPDAYVSEGVRMAVDSELIRKWKDNCMKRWFPSREWTWHIGESAYLAMRLSEGI